MYEITSDQELDQLVWSITNESSIGLRELPEMYESGNGVETALAEATWQMATKP